MASNEAASELEKRGLKRSIVATLCVVINELVDMEEEEILPKIRRHLPKTRKFFENVNDMDKVEFISHFRLSRGCFMKVVEMVTKASLMKLGLSHEQRCLVAVWYLANPGGYRNLSQQFGIAYSTAYLCVYEVTRNLNDAAVDVIKMPTVDEMPIVADKFQIGFGFPGVIGCIDGTHIKIHPPALHAMDYITRKSVFAINLTTVADADLRLRSIAVGYSGKTHDSRIFQELPLFSLLDHVPKQFHILGDAAYPNSVSLLTPYTYTDEMKRSQTIFNKKHSSTCMAVERAFGLLQSKWLKLHDLRCQLPNVNRLVVACCVLHNLHIDSQTAAAMPEQSTPTEALPQTSDKRDRLARLMAVFQ